MPDLTILSCEEQCYIAMNIRYFFIIVLLVFASCGSDETEHTDSRSERQLEFTSTVHFTSADGEIVTSIAAAVADDDVSRSEGLMDVHNLPENSGMLFIFDDEAQRSFWMANTPLSLDIIFANSEFEIVRIHRNTPPYSNEQILSEAPAKYVVEVNAGYTISHDINEGMYIQFD